MDTNLHEDEFWWGLTRDLIWKAGTNEFAEAVIGKMEWATRFIATREERIHVYVLLF